MSEENLPSAEALANRIFAISMAGVFTFVVVVFVFIIF